MAMTEIIKKKKKKKSWEELSGQKRPTPLPIPQMEFDEGSYMEEMKKSIADETKQREKRKKAREKQRKSEKVDRGKSPESKPAKRLKRAEPEKPTSEFMEKYYGKDWA